MKYIVLLSLLLSSYKLIGSKDMDNFDTLTSKIDSIVINSKFNGVILLTKDKITLYSKATGYSDIENKTGIELNSQFVIGSISKQITAVLVMKEYEKGKIKLNDKINKHLSEINQPWSNSVTIHQLLTHTHGIIDINKPLEFEQGSQFHYSQLGYELLANILEKVTGKTFIELSTELFAQYGLNDSFHPENKVYTNLVKGYEEDKNGILNYCSNSTFIRKFY